MNHQKNTIVAGKYREILDGLPRAVRLMNTKGGILFANRMYHDMFGFPNKVLTGKTIYEFAATKKDRSTLSEMISRIQKGRPSTFRFITTVLSSNGDPMVIEENWSPIEGNTGEITGIISEITDVSQDMEHIRGEIEDPDLLVDLQTRILERTWELEVANEKLMREIEERRQVEIALRESEEKFSKIFRASPVGMLIISLNDWRIVDLNHVFSRITGYERIELLGLRPCDARFWVKKEDPETFWNTFRNQRNIQDTPISFRHGSGELRSGLLSSEIIHIRYEPCVIVTLRDITEQKRTQAEKQRLEEQLRLAEKMEAIGKLAGGLAHDFNNLMMGIQGRTSIMLSKTAPSDFHFDHLRGIEEYVQKASNITGRLLNFARGGKNEVVPTDLNELLRNSAEIFGGTKKEILISFELSENLKTVNVDRSQMEQVFLNLFVNAWQAMPGGGELTIRTENREIGQRDADGAGLEPGSYVQFSVSDTGIGIDEGNLDKVFDPFFTTKEMGGGSGLGLASVYGIIRDHGGHIRAVPGKPRGTRFEIVLPASDEKSLPELYESSDLVTGTGMILLVDDEEMIIEVGREMMELLGYTVLTAKNGFDAVALFEKYHHAIDLVILDMIMPKLGGVETFKKLKRIDPELCVLLSSGYSLNEKTEALLRQGCRGFIQKPFKMEALSQKITELTGN